MSVQPPATRPFSAFLIAGEDSGDQLGAGLMAALRQRLTGNIRFQGVGGERMGREALNSLFPIADISVMGFAAVLARLPTIARRLYATVDAVVAARPDVLILIDSPDFTLRVAARVRRRAPDIPIVLYVSPTVWAWRSGRARRMRPHIDRILANLPFEPAVHERLDGPACTYVGHPLIEKLPLLRPRAGERVPLAEAARPTLVVLPGSRRGEVARLMDAFGMAVGRVVEGRGTPVEVILPAVEHLAEEIETRSRDWPVRPTIVRGEEAKFAAFRRAHAALAASGTVTLELALAGVPMVVAYRTDFFSSLFARAVIKTWTIVLPNLVLDEHAVREYINNDATPVALASGLLPLLADTPARAAQVDAFARLEGIMTFPDGTPSSHAADAVLATAARRNATAASSGRSAG